MRGSAEKEAAKTTPSPLRWRLRVWVYVGLKVERLVMVVELSAESVEMRRSGWDVWGSFVVSLTAWGK